jgi:hypothetical protein
MTERNALCSLQFGDVTADFTAGTQEFFSIVCNFFTEIACCITRISVPKTLHIPYYRLSFLHQGM